MVITDRHFETTSDGKIRLDTSDKTVVFILIGESH
jgi:hypothetical protein